MFQQMKKRIKNEKGLTLIELLAVIVILAIIAVIAIPAIGNIINSSRDKGQVSDAISIIEGAKLAHIDTGCGDDGCDKDDLKDYVDGKSDDFMNGITVSLNKGEWTIGSYPFEFKSKKFEGKEPEPATEKALKELIEEEKE